MPLTSRNGKCGDQNVPTALSTLLACIIQRDQSQRKLQSCNLRICLSLLSKGFNKSILGIQAQPPRASLSMSPTENMGGDSGDSHLKVNELEISAY